MKIIKIIQTVLAILAIFGVAIILEKFIRDPSGTTDCETFLIAYIFQFIGFFITVIFSILIYKKEKSNKSILLYVPLLYALAFIVLYIGYQFEVISIYDPSLRGFERGEGCYGNFVMQLLSHRF